ncbi:MAG: branched-chain amino acid ABC transporter permease [Coriobacteriia bacterium]|nr:branched-chain amino acid ABC transporter permease [Coriobacteriia bacterium]
MSTGMRKVSDVLKHRSTLVLLSVPILLGAVGVHFFASSLVVSLYTYFCVNLILVLALQMFMGNSGILNLTHVGWVGIGAYVSSILSVPPAVKSMGVPNMYPALVELSLPIVPAIFIGGVVAAAIAAIIAWPLMRLSNAVGVITLFATLIVMHVVMTQWDNVTNGPRTFFGVPFFTTLWIALAGALVTLAAAHYFRESSLGLRLRASRDDRFAAYAMGVNVVQTRYFTFVLSAFVAGIGGGLWAHYITSFSPKAFYIVEIFMLLTMLVIGGAGSVSGAVAGTAIVTVLREVLRQVENTLSLSDMFNRDVYGLTELSMAVLMVIILIWRPGGVVGGREVAWPLLRARRRASEVASADVASDE